MVRSASDLDGSKWNDEDIVITGISARLPNCDSVEEFQEKLLAKVDLITDEPRRFQSGLYGAIKRYGLLKDLSKFDAKFFNIHPRQAERMDPQIRNLLEVAYEATVDAGLHPEDLSGSRTGIVVGVASSETQDKWSQMPNRINGYEYTGCTRTMFANRVSHYLNLKGPSYSIDTASSTTLVAFQQAYDMIKDGVCDACFVCGTDLVLNPCVCLMFQCLNMLSPEGKCKAFDISGDGYVRSEGVVAVLLQKAKSAKRIYAHVLSAGSNCDGYKDDGITFPSGEQQMKLFKRVAQLADIDPSTIDFMEAHGSATRVGDPQEMNAVTEVFAKGRKQPLRTGSIKSNMGHGEPASALSAVIKICVTMECGIIPPNLHYNIPNPDIPALLDGRLKVITEPTPWDGGLVAVNSFGVGGANGHALLLSNKKIKEIVPDTIPRLICVSGVTENAVKNMLNKLHSLPRDPELYALLNNIHRKNIKGHGYRGYMIINGELIKHVQKVSFSEKKNLCLTLPGIESKWKSIEDDILQLPIFQSSIKKCEKELKSVLKSINLNSILKSLENEKSPLNFVIGITALQIGFIDILYSLEIFPDYIIGCGIGEIAAGYADNKYTLQQAILSAYYIGNVLQFSFYPSSIARTDMPRKIPYPKDISICAKIAPKCTYVSGPTKSVQSFIQTTKEKGFQIKEVECFAIDHNGILQKSGQILKLVTELEKILGKSNRGSNKWLTYSSLQSNSSNIAQHLIYSLTGASHIQKALTLMEKSTILEIGFAFHEEDSEQTNETPLFLLNNNATVWTILSSIGLLYNVGFQPQIQNLYPKVDFPVSHKTPMIQSMIEWDHSEKWNVVSFAAKDNRVSGEFEVEVDFDKDEFSSLPGNFINQCEIFPKSFYVNLVWKTIARFQNKPLDEVPLTIEHLYFSREVPIPESDTIKFTINILETSGKFEVRANREIIASGQVRIPADLSKECLPKNLMDSESFENVSDNFNKDYIYKQLIVKQYQYNDSFKQLQSTNYKNNVFEVNNHSWYSLIESFLQASIFCENFEENSHSVVSFIRKIVIDPKQFEQNKVSTIKYNKKWNTIKNNNLEIRGIKLQSLPSITRIEPTLEYYEFVPFVAQQYESAAEASIMLALENWTGHTDLKIAELVINSSTPLLSSKLQNANPFIKTEVTVYSDDINYFSNDDENQNIKFVCKDASIEQLDNNCHIVIASNVLDNSSIFTNLVNSVRMDGCILLQEDFKENFIENENVTHISTLSSQDKMFILFKKVQSVGKNTPRVITVSNLNDCVQKLENIPDGNTLIFARGAEVGGIAKFVKSVMFKIKNLSAMFIEDQNAPLFSLTNAVYTDQLKKNFPVSFYKNGTWGVYLPFTLKENITAPTQDVFIGLDYKNDSIEVDYVQSNSAIYKQLNDPWNIVCDVHYATINMRDYNLYKGKLSTKFSLPDAESQKYQLGMEFSGYKNNKKIFGLVSGGALATTVIADSDFLWDLPQNWSLEEASSVPYSYAMAYYTFCVRGNIQKGNSILIIGDNGIARAAVRIALHYNTEVFVLLTDNKQKSEFLKAYPQIKNSQIIVSKNNNYYLEVLEKTGGEGVNVLFVTVPVQTYTFQSYVSSLAAKGNCFYFNSVYEKEEMLGASGNLRCITFHRIVLSCIFENVNVNIRKKINQLMNEGLKNGVVQPLSYTVFAVEDIVQALQFNYEDNSVCKTILNIRNNVNEKTYPAKLRTYFDNNKYFVIRGGLEDFGSHVVDWMVTQGAHKLVFVSSETEIKNQSLLKMFNEKWKNVNCNTSAFNLNEFSLKNCETIMQKISQLGSIGGVFDFTQFEPTNDSDTNSSNDKVMKHLNQKVDFLTNMDKITRKLCPNLEFFVSFSSVEYEYGSVEKSIYHYVNGIVQNLMRNRKNSNLSATFIQWGLVGESFTDTLYNTSASELSPQPVNSCLHILHKFLKIPHPVLSSFVTSAQSNSQTESKVDIILEGVGKFLGIKDTNSVLPTLTMLELGLDSLIGTDIQQFLEINYGVVLSTQEVRELTFEKLRNLAENL